MTLPIAPSTAAAEALANALLVLDGAVGTEIAARGADVSETLDAVDEHDNYWSGKALMTAPVTVQRVHEDYLLAGADVVTADTFRVNTSVVRRLGVALSASTLLSIAVSLARAACAATGAHAAVGASIGPVAACDAPMAAPGDEELERIHRDTVAALVNANADLLLPETMNSTREAVAVAIAASQSNLPFLVAFTVNGDGRTLPSGDSLASAAEAVADIGASAVLVNHVPPATIDRALPVLFEAVAGSHVRVGARPHLEKATPTNGWREPGGLSPAGFADRVGRWIDAGATIVGGCCGTTPSHIAAVRGLVGELEEKGRGHGRAEQTEG